MEDIGGQSIARHILVEGSSGMGKTITLSPMTEGKMLQDKKIVLLLQLRSKRVREAKSLSDLFYHEDDSIKHEVLKHIKSVNGREDDKLCLTLRSNSRTIFLSCSILPSAHWRQSSHVAYCLFPSYLPP